MSISGAAIGVYNTANQSEPPGCQGKVVIYTSPLSVQTSDTLDLRQAVLRGLINAIQAVWVDNFNGGAVVTISVQGTNQIISVPNSRQGWVPIAVIPGNEVFTIAGSGGTDIPLMFSNVPMPAAIWGQ